MNCKDCIRQKHCKDKIKPPALCRRFIDYSESKKFEAYDRMMRQNRGLNFP